MWGGGRMRWSGTARAAAPAAAAALALWAAIFWILINQTALLATGGRERA